MTTTLKRRPLEREAKAREAKRSVVPVKFSSLGTPYVDSSVSAISPERLEALIEDQLGQRDERKK